jgi:hypothetical protein
MLQISIRSVSPESLKAAKGQFLGAFYRLATGKLYSPLYRKQHLVDALSSLTYIKKRKAEEALLMPQQPTARSTTSLAICNAYLLRGERTWPKATRSSRGGCKLKTSTHPNETNIHNSLRPPQTRSKLRQAHPCHSKTWQHLEQTPRLLLRRRHHDDGGADSGFPHSLSRPQRPTFGHAGRARLGFSQSSQRGRRVVQAKRRLRADQPGGYATMRAFPILFSSSCK